METSRSDKTALDLKNEIDEVLKRLNHEKLKAIRIGATTVPEEYTKLKKDYDRLVKEYYDITKSNYNPNTINQTKKLFAPTRARTASSGSDISAEEATVDARGLNR